MNSKVINASFSRVPPADLSAGDLMNSRLWYTSGADYIRLCSRLKIAVDGLRRMYYRSYLSDDPVFRSGMDEVFDLSDADMYGYPLVLEFYNSMIRAMQGLAEIDPEDDGWRRNVAAVCPQVYLHDSRRTIGFLDFVLGIFNQRISNQNNSIECFELAMNKVVLRHSLFLKCPDFMLSGFLSLVYDKSLGVMFAPQDGDPDEIRDVICRLNKADPANAQMFWNELQGVLTADEMRYSFEQYRD